MRTTWQDQQRRRNHVRHTFRNPQFQLDTIAKDKKKTKGSSPASSGATRDEDMKESKGSSPGFSSVTRDGLKKKSDRSSPSVTRFRAKEMENFCKLCYQCR